MFTVFSVLQIIISVLLIAVILLQEGKKGMGAIFGGSSSSIFGAKGAANILVKITALLATLFMLNSLWLAYISTEGGSVTDQVEQRIESAKKDEAKTEAAKEMPQTAPAAEAKPEAQPAPATVPAEAKPAENVDQKPAEAKPAEPVKAEEKK